MHEQTGTAAYTRRLRVGLAARTLLRHWLAIFIVGFGLFNLLPFVAPLAMWLGLDRVGNAIYAVYSALCHQMAQRSFFLFGPQPMYNIAQLPVTMSGDTAADMLLLRQFQGGVELGWKVAWSDRMVYLYGGLWLGSLIYWVASWRRSIRHLPLWLFVVALVPMAIDGGTHFISDLSGLTTGFRYHNVWLADLTNYALPAAFYAGGVIGSFNSLMRLVSGLLMGGAAAWLAIPILDQELRHNYHTLNHKLLHAQARASSMAPSSNSPLAKQDES